MQTSTPASAAPVTPAAPAQRRNGGLATATAIVAFVSAALDIAAIFLRWNATTTLHDTFVDVENNLLFAAVLVVAGVFLLVSRREWVRAAAALLLAGHVISYLPGIGSNVSLAVKDGGVAAGFWIGQLANIAGVAAAVMALVFAFSSGVWSWRPSDRAESPVLIGAIGFLGVLLATSWTLSATRVFDASNTLVDERFGPLGSRLAETSGFAVGAALVVLALLVVVCTRPAPLSGFLLMGLTVAGIADIFGFDQWGYDASQGGIVGPGPGVALGYLVTVGLLFVAVVLATQRVETADAEPAPAPPQTPTDPYAVAPAAAVPATLPAQQPAPPQAPPPTPPAPMLSPEAQSILAQLDDLHARGLLSAEEHAAKRAQVLGS